MATNPQTFHHFKKLPLELQSKIWREGVKQTPPRVFELHSHEPEPKDLRVLHNSSSAGIFEQPRPKITIAGIVLYERSVEFQRPLLAVDRSSRRENLRYYQRVKFLNAHVWMNMEADIIYLGYFKKPSIDKCFHPLRTKDYFDPFWNTVKHLALGISDVYEILLTEARGRDYTWHLNDLQQFPALETFTLVLDVIERAPGTRWPPRVNGSITFEDPWPGCATNDPSYQKDWMDYFEKIYRATGGLHPEWNVPDLYIKSIRRGNRIQYVDWGSDLLEGLPEWITHEEIGEELWESSE